MPLAGGTAALPCSSGSTTARTRLHCKSRFCSSCESLRCHQWLSILVKWTLLQTTEAFQKNPIEESTTARMSWPGFWNACLGAKGLGLLTRLVNQIRRAKELEALTTITTIITTTTTTITTTTTTTTIKTNHQKTCCFISKFQESSQNHVF